MRISDWSSDVCSSDLYSGCDHRRPAGWGSGCAIGLVRILCIQGRHNHGDSVAGTHLAATGNLRRSDTGEAVKTINFSRIGLWALGLLIALLLPYVLVSGYQLRSEEHTSELPSLILISY